MTESRYLAKFGASVRMHRVRLDLSQEGLAAKAGLHRTYISGVERGVRNLGLRNLIRLSRALQLAPSALLCDVESQR